MGGTSAWQGRAAITDLFRPQNRTEQQMGRPSIPACSQAARAHGGLTARCVNDTNVWDTHVPFPIAKK